MRRRAWIFRMVVATCALAGCNLISGVGDYTFAPEAGTADAANDVGPTQTETGAPDADAATTPPIDAGGDAPSDAGSDVKDAAVPCTLPVPSTGDRKLECGESVCVLDPGVPPICCEGNDASDGVCQPRDPPACAPPRFVWECTRAYQCPLGSPVCCLAYKDFAPTCPPTVKAIGNACHGIDVGCGSSIELCTNTDTCYTPGTKCVRLDVVGYGARALGACL